jgi:flagellar protein FliT
MSTLSLYEQMSGLSAEMAVAARENDWDRVSALEGEITRLRNTLLAADPLDRAPAPMSDIERRKKADLIKRILADDREVRRHTEPWMESVRTMLGGASRGRAMRAAYSVVAE